MNIIINDKKTKYYVQIKSYFRIVIKNTKLQSNADENLQSIPYIIVNFIFHFFFYFCSM